MKMVSLPKARPGVICSTVGADYHFQPPKADKPCLTKCTPLRRPSGVGSAFALLQSILRLDRDGPSVSNVTEACHIL